MKKFKTMLAICAMLLLIGSMLYMSVVYKAKALEQLMEDMNMRCASATAEINGSLQYSQNVQTLFSHDYNVRKLSKLKTLKDVPGIVSQIEHTYSRLILLRNSSTLIENASLCLLTINRTLSSNTEFLRGISEKHKQAINTFAHNPLQNVVSYDSKLFFVQPLNTTGDSVSNCIVMEISSEKIVDTLKHTLQNQTLLGDDIWVGLINSGQVIASAGESPFKAEYGVAETLTRMFSDTNNKRVRLNGKRYRIFMSPLSTLNASVYTVIPDSYFVAGYET